MQVKGRDALGERRGALGQPPQCKKYIGAMHITGAARRIELQARFHHKLPQISKFAQSYGVQVSLEFFPC